MPNQSPSLFGKRILILAAHPDDEVVACAAAVGRAIEEGAVVYALFLTNGCIARETLWPWQRKHYNTNVVRRLQESVAVAQLLHITPLSYADRPARSLWHNMNTVFQEIQNAIREQNIDQIWIPAYEGGNADHDGLNGLCRHLKGTISILEFAEYNYANGKAHAQSFPAPNGTETTLTLTDDERLMKQRMLKLYVSEQCNLGYVKTIQECFRPLADYDYSLPPHEGKVWYARFHWVPFNHPRIDFTKPHEVSDKISAFVP